MMRTIEMNANITPEGSLIIQMPPDIPEGEYRVVVTLEEQPATNQQRPPLEFPVDSYGSWPEDLSLRREDMYDEWGR